MVKGWLLLDPVNRHSRLEKAINAGKGVAGVDLANRRASIFKIYCFEDNEKTDFAGVNVMDIASLQHQLSAHLLAKALPLSWLCFNKFAVFVGRMCGVMQIVADGLPVDVVTLY